MSDAVSKVYGWKGKLLRIDLSSRNSSLEDLDEKVLVECIGGRGLASRLLVDEVDPKTDPLDSNNKLVFSAGPLVGTIAPGASRTHVVSKSPVTGMLSCLNLGGHFGAALRSAGYDAIVIEGRSEEPVYVRVDGDLVELRSARELWGKSVSETQAAVRAAADREPRQTGVSRTKRPTTRAVAGENAEVLCIGPAGERLDRIATLVGSEHWTAGGAGLGAVMGSKNLKAIAVSGCTPAMVADVNAFGKAVARTMDRLKENYVYYRRLAAYGTGSFVRIAQERGVLPTMNYRGGAFVGADSITGEAVADNILKKSTACFGCPNACGRLSGVNGSQGAGPEYEHLFGFGSNCGISDLPAIAQAAYQCRESGLDAVSAAAAVAEALELAEIGALKGGEIDQGLKFGDGDSLIKLVEQMASGRGLGKLLCQGPREVAEQLDHPELFVGLNGQALAAYDPRSDEVMGLCYATAGNALGHLPGTLVRVGPDPADTVGEAIRLQDFASVVDSAGLCPLMAATYSLEDVAALLSATTGIDYSEESLRGSGANVWRAERAFGLRSGAAGAQALPARLMEPLNEGPAAGLRLRTDELLPAYNRARNSGGQ